MTKNGPKLISELKLACENQLLRPGQVCTLFDDDVAPLGLSDR